MKAISQLSLLGEIKPEYRFFVTFLTMEVLISRFIYYHMKNLFRVSPRQNQKKYFIWAPFDIINLSYATDLDKNLR